MNNVKSVPAPNISTDIKAVTCPFSDSPKFSASSAATDCATSSVQPTPASGNNASAGER